MLGVCELARTGILESGARFPAKVFEITGDSKMTRFCCFGAVDEGVVDGGIWTVLSLDDTVGRRRPLVGIELRCLGAMVLECFGFGGRFSFPKAEGRRR